MSAPLIHVIGIGENGLNSLGKVSRALLEKASCVIGGQRHLDMIAGHVEPDEKVVWPSPFSIPVKEIESHIANANTVAVLATGDPLWFGVAKRLIALFDKQVCVHPYVSAFQLAACRMGWPLEDVTPLSVHGRPVGILRPLLNPSRRFILLSDGSTMTVPEIIRMLLHSGHEEAQVTALCHMEGVLETRISARAYEWDAAYPLPSLHTLAIECAPDAPVHPLTGLPDTAFLHDGKITKQSIRAVTLMRLQPVTGATLWDLGTGCGSVAIEWQRATANGTTIGTDINTDRLKIARRNAMALGTPLLELRHQSNLDFVTEMSAKDSPDAVFIGGGLSHDLVDRLVPKLAHGSRLVCNSVTLQSESILLACFEKYQGHLERISVGTATDIGRYTGWKASMPVLQWSFQKCRHH